MADPVDPRVAAFGNIYGTLGPEFKTDWDAVRAKNAELKAYLGTTDYSAQNQEANDFAKLQFALSLMGRAATAFGAAPQPGESPAGTVGRTLVAPIAGDISTIAGPLMKQRAATRLAEQQEERQRRMAAYTATAASAKEQRALALNLLGDAPKPAAIKQGNRGFARRVNKAGKPTGPVVPLQYTYDPKTDAFAARPVGEGTQKAAILSGDNRTHVVTNEAGEILGAAGKGTDTYKDNLVVVSTATGKPVVDSQGRRIQVSRKGNQLFQLGSTDVYNQPKDTRLVPVSKFDTPGSGGSETDAQRKNAANRTLLFSSMNRFQNRQLQGENTPWSANSALFWDQATYINNGNKLLGDDGSFALKYIPSGTSPAEAASRAVTITNQKVIEFITNKAHALADATLTSTFGEQTNVIKMERLEKAVKNLLSQNEATLFGASSIDEIGQLDGRKVGYVPGAGALSPGLQNQAIKAAFDTLKGNPGANPVQTFAPVAHPRSVEGLNKTSGRVAVAIRAFPDAFGAPQVPGSPSTYDSGLAQRRRDIEAVLPNVRLLVDASPQDSRAVIAEAAAKKAAARNKLQNSSAAVDARDLFQQRLDFRRALIDFRNAAAAAGNIEGFVTGPITAGLARVGIADWIKTGGAEHWERLTIASDRFQNGQSRRVGKEFGDVRISNYDAEAYRTLVAGINKGKTFNKTLVEDGLRRSNRELTDLMSIGGKVGWTERELKQAAEAGVDFSELRTMEDWHGYGYYGKDRYSSTRQQALSLSQDQRNNIRSQGQLKDTLYGGKYTVPKVSYSTDTVPTWQRGREKTDQGPAIKPTLTKRLGPLEFEVYLKAQADAADVSLDVMRQRVVRGIQSYNIWQGTLR